MCVLIYFFTHSLSLFLSFCVQSLDVGQDEAGGGSNGASGGASNGATGTNGSNLPHSSSTASLHHLTAANAPPSNHHSGSSIDATSADLQHKVSILN